MQNDVKKQPLFRTFHGRSDRPSKGMDFSEAKNMTREEFARDLDLNRIVPQILKTGVVDPDLVRNISQFVDCTRFDDYERMCQLQAQAKSNFERLPAHIRDYFHGDMHAFYEFMDNSNNRDQAIKLGLVAKSDVSAGDAAAPGAAAGDAAVSGDAAAPGDAAK